MNKKKIILENREDILSYLIRYYEGKALLAQITKYEDGFDASCSEFDLYIENYKYTIWIMRERKGWVNEEHKHIVKKFIEVEKPVYKEITKLIKNLNKKKSEVMSIEDFILILTTRKETIDTILETL